MTKDWDNPRPVCGPAAAAQVEAAASLTAVLAVAAVDVREAGAVGVLTGVALLREGGDVVLRMRSKAAPMHLVMAASAVLAEAEDGIRRAGGDNTTTLAGLAVARIALKYAME